jgi:type II secretory pathway component PulF
MGLLFGLLTAVLIFTTARASQLARRRRALIVLSHIDTTLRMNLPIVPMLRRFAEAEARPVARMLNGAADQLARGAWLSEALDDSDVDLPRRTFDHLGAAERAGQLPRAIEQELCAQRARRAVDPSDRPFVRVYSIILLVMIPTVATVISIFVMPRYQQILKGFGIARPWVMQLLIELTSTIAPVLAALGVLLFILASQVAISEISRARPRRWTRAIRGLIDRVRWVTPIVGRLDRDRGWADVCQTVADGLDAQRPLSAMAAEARQPHLNVMLARRVATWGDALAQGVAPGDAATAARFPELISGMLGRDRDVPDLPATLHFLARYYRSRFSRLQIVLRDSAIPLLALTGGAGVLLVALSLIAPIVAITERLSLPWPRP